MSPKLKIIFHMIFFSFLSIFQEPNIALIFNVFSKCPKDKEKATNTIYTYMISWPQYTPRSPMSNIFILPHYISTVSDLLERKKIIF